MRFSGQRALPLLAVAFLRSASSHRLQLVRSNLQKAPSLADFGAVLPQGATISEAEHDAIIQKLVEAQHDEEANRCTISLEPLLVDNKVGNDGLVVVVEPPGEGARAGSQVRVNMYNVPAARRWYCVAQPVDPVINLPLGRTNARVLVLSKLEGPLCPVETRHQSAMPMSRETRILTEAVRFCNVGLIIARSGRLTDTSLRELDRNRQGVLKATIPWNCVRGAQLLLPRMDNASVGVPDIRGLTVLHDAAARGQRRLASLFLAHMDEAAVNARVDAHQFGCETALAMAARKGFLATTRTILAATDADQVRYQDVDNRTILHYAAEPFSPTQAWADMAWPRERNLWSNPDDEVIDKCGIIRIILGRMDEDGVLLKDRDGLNALHMAVKLGKQDVVDTLLSGMSARAIRAPDGHSMTALHLAAHYGQPGHLHSVLEAIPDDDFVVARTDAGKTALHLAMARRGASSCREDECAEQHRLVRELLDRMGRSMTSSQHIAARDDGGGTALHSAALDAEGWYAKMDGHVASVRLLLQHMAVRDVAAADHTGMTALHHAARRSLADLVQELLTAMDSAAIRAQDGEGMTALHHAARRGNVWIAVSILEHMDRAALDLKNVNGKTARQLATEVGDHTLAARIMMRRMFAK